MIHFFNKKINLKNIEKSNAQFEVHLNESACRKKVSLGMEKVFNTDWRLGAHCKNTIPYIYFHILYNFYSLSMYLVSDNSSLFFFEMEFASYSSKSSFTMLSSKHFIGSFMYVTTYITYFALSNFLCTYPFSLSLNVSKDVPISNILDSKPSTTPPSSVSPLKYMLTACIWTSSFLLRV